MNESTSPIDLDDLDALEPDSLKQLIYDNDGHNIAIATADGSICLGNFDPAFEQSLPDFGRILDRYNQIPALTSEIRKLEGERNQAREALITANKSIKSFAEQTCKTLDRLQAPMKKHQEELTQIGRDFDNHQALTHSQISLLVDVLSKAWDELEGRERFDGNDRG